MNQETMKRVIEVMEEFGKRECEPILSLRDGVFTLNNTPILAVHLAHRLVQGHKRWCLGKLARFIRDDLSIAKGDPIWDVLQEAEALASEGES